jgi:hypothetical protein
MVFVNLCIFLGIPLALFGLRWFLGGPPDATDRDERSHAPWD